MFKSHCHKRCQTTYSRIICVFCHFQCFFVTPILDIWLSFSTVKYVLRYIAVPDTAAGQRLYFRVVPVYIQLNTTTHTLLEAQGRYTLHYNNRLHDYTGASFWENPSRQFGHNRRDPAPKAGLIIIYSQYLQYRNMTQYPEGRVHLCRTWDEVLALIEKAHGPSTSVGVYPYVVIQHRPITIDGP